MVKKIPWTAAKFADFLPQSTLNTIFFKPTSAEEIQSIITTMKSKSSCGIDDIPFKVIKFTPNNILTALLHVFNLSLSQRKFIEHFKAAKIIPIYKKVILKTSLIIGPYAYYHAFLNSLKKLCKLAEVESSRTHFEVLGLGLEASSPRKLACPRLEDSTIF